MKILREKLSNDVKAIAYLKHDKDILTALNETVGEVLKDMEILFPEEKYKLSFIARNPNNTEDEYLLTNDEKSELCKLMKRMLTRKGY